MGQLLLLLLLLPFVDLYLLVRIGERLGWMPTLLGVVLVGMVGAALARREGVRVLGRWQEALARGQVPEEGVLSGLLVLLAGLLLVLPGVLTDVVGLLLLLPPVRRLVAHVVRGRLEAGIARGTVQFVDFRGPAGPVYGGGFPPRAAGGPRPGVIDVQGEEVVEPAVPPTLPR